MSPYPIGIDGPAFHTDSSSITTRQYLCTLITSKYCKQCVCMYVRLSARMFQNHSSKLHQVFCTLFRSWLGPRLTTTLQYVLYFRFCGLWATSGFRIGPMSPMHGASIDEHSSQSYISNVFSRSTMFDSK